MPAITSLDLSNAKLDVDHIAAIATSLNPTATDRLGHTKKTMMGAVATIMAFNDRGSWAASTSYAVKDLVNVSGTWYVAVVAHASSASFATDQSTKWRVYQGVTIGDLSDVSASNSIGYKLNTTGASPQTIYNNLSQSVSITDFGAVGDGIADDTNSIQNAINAMTILGVKKLRIPNGTSGVYKTTSTLTITNGGITIEWDNSNISIKKYFNGEILTIRAGIVSLINPGMDGNGADGFSGGGIRFGPASQFTVDCVIQNPRIFGTTDSCLLFEGPRGAAGIMVSGGSLLTYNPGGASSGGFPSIRVVGPTDADVSNRKFVGVSSSSQILIDITGMWLTKITDCFTGTILFKENPNVTGISAPFFNSETSISGTYIRDGLTISGSEVVINNSTTHGFAPRVVTYGGTPTYETYGWRMTVDTIACRIGSANVVSKSIVDDSPNGLAIVNQCSLFEYGRPMTTGWTGSVTNPSVGNGIILSIFDTNYKTINFRTTLTTGATTNRGVGTWSFALPKWASLQTYPVGNWTLVRPGSSILTGQVILSSTGATHRVAMVDSAGNYLSDVFPATLPTGSTLSVDISYSKG